jgi:drug/metabolite transporter (DMT)-like permease
MPSIFLLRHLELLWAPRMLVESIGWKHLLGVALILVAIAIVIARRDQFHPRMMVAIGLMMVGSMLLFLDSIFQFGLGFVDLELVAIVAWMAATGLALTLLGQDDGGQTDI